MPPLCQLRNGDSKSAAWAHGGGNAQRVLEAGTQGAVSWRLGVARRGALPLPAQQLQLDRLRLTSALLWGRFAT